MTFFALLELGFFVIFFFVMVVGTSLDRNYNAVSLKWWALFIGLVLLCIINWSDFSFASLLTWNFWTPALQYLGLGLLYTIPEFVLTVRRTAKMYAEKWQNFLNTTYAQITKNDPLRFENMGELIKYCKADTHAHADEEFLKVARSFVNNRISGFISDTRDFDRFLDVQIIDGELRPVIRESTLIEHLSAWAVLWPFYLVSLVLGDLVKEMFTKLASAITFISSRFVRGMFSGVFKV